MSDASPDIRAVRKPIALGRMWGTRSKGLALAVCGLTTALGAFRLGAKSFWTDEAFSDAMSRLGVSTAWKAIIRGDPFNGLYYAFLHLWQFGGHSETWLRLLSVVFGILAAYTLFLLNRRLFGIHVAVASGVLLAFNAFFVYYEQDARTYTLVVFLVVLSTYLLVLALDHGSIGRWLAYGLVGALSVYAHFFAAFVIAAHLVYLVAYGTAGHRGNRIRAAAAGYGLMALLVAPLVVEVLRTDSLERRFIDKVSLGSFRWLFLNLTGAGGVSTGGGSLLLFGYFAICCLAILWMGNAVLRRHRDGRERIWSYTLVLAWLVVPIMGSFAVSLVRSPIFYPRYLVVALPPLVTIAGIGIAGLPRRWLQFTAGAILVALSIHPLLSYYRGHFNEGEDWRRAVAYVTQEAQAGDGVVFLSRYGRRPFEYYLRQFGGGADLTPIYPSMPWGGYVPVLTDVHIESSVTAAARLQSYRRVWVVLLWEGFRSVDEDPGPFTATLQSHYGEAARQAFGWQLEVRLYQRTGG
jgi:mannosyltransferase